MVARAIIAALLLLLPVTASAQSVVLTPWPKAHFEDNNGHPCSGCKLFTYAAGTTTKQNTYTDSTGGTANVNPVLLNTRGEANVWLTPSLSYKFVLATSTAADPPAVGSVYWTVDNILTTGLFAPATTATYSSLNSLYFPTFSQLAAYVLKLNMTGAVSDSAGSFRDSIYIENTDTDTTVYTQEHVNYAGRFAAFGPNTGSYQTTYKNIVAIQGVAEAATTSTTVGSPATAPGVSGVLADAFQYGGGIGDNEVGVHQPSAANGSNAQSISLAGLQIIIDSNYANEDASHTSYGLLVSNTGTSRITAAIGFSGTGTQKDFLQANGATVSNSAIVMPHSATALEGSIIDYGRWNGNPVGGSYTWWSSTTSGGQYGWTDSGVTLASLDTKIYQVGRTVPVHLAAGQTTKPALTACGTSPSIIGTDVAGEVTMGTGTPVGCVITFNVAYVSQPICTVTWQATPLASQSYTISTTAITLVQTATSSNKVDYHCIGQSGG